MWLDRPHQDSKLGTLTGKGNKHSERPSFISKALGRVPSVDTLTFKSVFDLTNISLKLYSAIRFKS